MNLASIVLFFITIAESYSSIPDLQTKFALLYATKTAEDFKHCFRLCLQKEKALLNVTKHLIRDGHVDLLSGILKKLPLKIPPAIIFDDREGGDEVRFLVKNEEPCIQRNNDFIQAIQATNFDEVLRLSQR